jgi:hypothetical protein
MDGWPGRLGGVVSAVSAFPCKRVLRWRPGAIMSEPRSSFPQYSRMMEAVDNYFRPSACMGGENTCCAGTGRQAISAPAADERVGVRALVVVPAAGLAGLGQDCI